MSKPKSKASDMLKEHPRGMVIAMASMGRVDDDCGLLEEYEAELAGQPAKILTKPTESAQVIQFPLLFGEDTRAVSNPLARCSLFAAVQKRHHFTDWVYIGELYGVKIEFKGEQWNQADHDTLMQLIKMARHKPYGQEVEVPVRAVLGGLGRHTQKSQRKQLFAEVERLKVAALRLTPRGERSKVVNLIEEVSTPQDQATEPEHRRCLSFVLNPKFARFFDEAQLTLFNAQERSRLGSSDLAKWLHLWIIGNAEQYPHKVETIRDKCGSQTKDLYRFRAALRVALELLKNEGFINDWRIDSETDLVHIDRTASTAQLIHLNKKAARPRKPREK